MKVLHVEAGQHLYGGALQVIYLIEGLKRRGVEGLLACPLGSDVARAAAAAGLPVEPLVMKGDLDLGLVRRLRRLIARERPDILHLHSRRGADLFGGLAGRLAGLPVVVSRRVDNPEPTLLVRAKYRLYDRVVTISEAIFRVLRDEGVPANKLVCVHSAVEPDGPGAVCDREAFAGRFGLDRHAPVLAVIAQLIPRKGHRFLLDAMPRLLESHPGLRLVLFGKGPLEQALRGQVRLLGIEEAVVFAGFEDDLPQLLGCIDVVVHPATREGLGVSLLQAASAGVPIAASRAGGIPEIVRHGVNGLLFEPGDGAGLVEAVERLLADRELASRMGEAGRRLVATEFSVDRMVEGNLAVYRELA